MWSHRSYKAKLPLRIFLAAANSMAFQVRMLSCLCLGDSMQVALGRKGRMERHPLPWPWVPCWATSTLSLSQDFCLFP